MKNIRCSSCGANIQPKENSSTVVCPYCDSSWILDSSEQIKKEFTPQVSQSTHTTQSPTASTQPRMATKSRPKANVFLFFFLLCCSFWPGIIYLVIIGAKQKEWDRLYKK